jgi:hypothetical protein
MPRTGRFAPGACTGAHRTGRWVGLTANLDDCGKSHPHRTSIPRTSSPQRGEPSVPTEVCYAGFLAACVWLQPLSVL